MLFWDMGSLEEEVVIYSSHFGMDQDTIVSVDNDQTREERSSHCGNNTTDLSFIFMSLVLE